MANGWRSHDEWKINDVGFSDVKNRILARPSNGNTEVWSMENHSSNWDHPVRAHSRGRVSSGM
jgi:bilirubin oxidase